jgi:outer membrane lipoprotein-sorting protein
MRVLLLYFLLTISLLPQTKDPNKIINDVKNKFNAVKDYQVSLRIEVDMKFLRIPKVSAIVYFKQPDKIKMESSDFAVLPKEGINFSPISFLNEQFTSIYVKEDTLDQSKVDVIKIIPLSDSTNVILTTLWIDIENLVINKVETTTKNRGTFVAHLKYGDLIEYGLPSSMNFNFNIDNPELTKMLELESKSDQKPADKSSDKFSGSIKVVYKNYKVNQGIPDEIFNEKSDKEKTK